jgi:hypothetical protein
VLPDPERRRPLGPRRTAARLEIGRELATVMLVPLLYQSRISVTHGQGAGIQGAVLGYELVIGVTLLVQPQSLGVVAMAGWLVI